MKMKINKYMIGCILSASFLAIATPVLVTSCSKNSSSEKSEIINLNKKYLNEETKYLSNNDSQLPKIDFDNIETSLNKSLKALLTNADNALNELEKYKANNQLSQDEQIWIDSYIFQWKNKKENIKSGMIFLGANPITGSRILGTSSNHISDFIKSGTNIYPINEETGDPNTQAAPQKLLVINLSTKLKETKEIIDSYKAIMEFGSNTYGYQASSISKKLLVNQLIQAFYQGELEQFANQQTSEISISNLTQLNSNNNYFNNIYENVEKTNYLNKDQLSELKTNLENLKSSLDNFLVWYSEQYYTNKDSFGNKISQDSSNYLKITKNNNDNEVEKSILINNKKLYGLGLSDVDLNTKKIGIGFMNLHDLSGTLFEEYNNPNKLYQQLLNNNNSKDDTAESIYQQGIDLTNNAKINMDKVAKKVKELVIGELNDSIMYDEDGIGSLAPTETNLVGDDFEKLNLWLNQEDFFFGRETLEGDDLKNFINEYWTNASGDLAKYKKNIIQQGYQLPWENQDTINGEQTGTVSGNQALAGAVLSYESYEHFKEQSDNLYNTMFNAIPDYVLSPYNYSVREDIGVGMEGPRGSNQFQYNCDPYYSLPKWSLSSLTTHEGKMGHHTQNAYWTKYLKGGDGSNGSGPGYTFVNDSFHEGWAVFTEWYANQLEIYGTNLDEDGMPTNFLTGNGLVPQYNEQAKNNNQILEQQTNIMKKLHGGVYYKKAKGADGSVEKLKNSIELANILQYYGYLNEAQLRNMRLCLDTAVHYNGTNGDSSLPYGASINDLRNYMKANSALSVGDIASESIRYSVMPSQATGYMLGKIIFNDLYTKVEQKLKISLSDPKNNKQSRELFDLMLRNGEIPLEVLVESITKHYDL